ncbi:hypothetical protein PRZ48_013757 [Zasmidium cellare]|uniref:Septin-type G domain-containing protein n=1 Tax=Zasmidium cellare TaxID=395010 RepID=A0ABR0E2H8_ZASCE|nr:hypothetical protein PRZ48_013757 [Zasmidium cellare]
METGYREADRLRDGVDWSVPHRAPPPVPAPVSPTSHHHAYSTVAEGYRGVESYSGDQAFNHAAATRDRGPFAGTGSDEAASVDSRSQHTGRRRGSSFSSLLKRSTSNSSQHNGANGVYTADASAPPLPNTRISQAHADAAAARKEQQSHKPRQSSNSSTRSSSFTMLRKSSKLKQQQQAEQARLPREPPHLPSLNPLPGLATFGGEDARPDSVAIFNNAYTHSQPAATNFSRPSAMAPSSNINSSSSPAYAARGANGIPRDSTSPPDSRAAPKTNGEYVVNPSYDRTESMTNRGRYSYASSTVNVNSVNSPRRVRRRKDPTPFNVLVIGAKNSGKTSFISFLRHSLALPSHKKGSEHQPESQVAGNRSSFTSTYIETEIDSERVGLTLWDSTGLEKNIVDLQLREMTAFVEAKFEDTFVEEQKVMRSPGVKDTHIHCVFLILDPVRLDSTINASAAFQKNGSHTGSLDDDLDLQVMRALWGKTTVIPVISKADTLTVGHMAFLKRAVWEALRVAKLDPLEALELEDDGEEDEEEDAEANGEDEESDEADDLPVPKTRRAHKRQSSLSALATASPDDNEPPYLPMSIISPDIYDLPPYAPKSKSHKIGRRFPWGFADPYDADHCDFGRLRDSIFSEWRADLRELSRTKWYENWRTSRLKNLPGARQRIKGGVTPVAAVPREGRMASQNSRQFSPPSQSTLGAATVPRSVSTNSHAASSAVRGASGETREVSGESVRY